MASFAAPDHENHGVRGGSVYRWVRIYSHWMAENEVGPTRDP